MKRLRCRAHLCILKHVSGICLVDMRRESYGVRRRFWCSAGTTLLFFILFSVFCGGKGAKGKVSPVKIGSDSVSVECVETVFGDSMVAPRDTAGAVLQCVLAQMGGKYAAASNDSVLMKKLADQLSMRTNRRWTQESAGFSLKIAAFLQAKTRQHNSALSALEELRKLISDSLVFRNPLIRDRLAEFVDSLLKKQAAASEGGSDADMNVMGALLGMPDDAAQVVSEFTRADQGSPKTADYAELAKGLIYNPETTRPKIVKAKKTEIKDNSKLALAHRGQQSIHDAIQKHRANLQALYKKQLKVDPYMSGTVWVTFKVAPAGRVVEVNVSRSDIKAGAFLGQLTQYLQNLQFSSIPEEIGDMVFEYPFTFTPDL